MNARYILFLKICIVIQAARGQEHFEPGTVVLINGDSIRGFIDNQNWGITPDKIDFKKSPEALATTSHPGELASCEHHRKDLYVARHVILHYRTDDIAELERMMDTLTWTGPRFLQVLYRGAADLYLVTDERSLKHFFVEKDTLRTTELELRRMIGVKRDPGANISALPAVATVEKYKQVLAYLFADCPSIQSKIRNCSYSERSLVHLFRDYSSCRNVKGHEIEPVKQKARVSGGVLLGASATTLNLTTEIDYLSYLDQQDYNYSIRPSAGLRLFIELPRNNGRYGIVNDFLYTAYRVEGTAPNGTGSTITNSFGNSYLGFHTQLHVDFSDGPLRTYGKAGMGNSFQVSNSSSFTITNGSGSTSYTDPRFYGMRTYEASFLMSFGVRKNRLQADLTCKFGNGFSQFTAIGSSTTSWLLLACWLF